MRRRIYDLVNIKDKCGKANQLYHELTTRKQEKYCGYSKIKINTLDQLKILEAVLEDIEIKHLMIRNRKNIDITKLSKNEINEAFINMNMFFNMEIRRHLFDSDRFTG